ncbi:DUF4398 domain-containing protein [Pseudomonas sp. 102515]|jgi:hypothetical protein|uniref:DUF4398 domain-containing protein n=1 Tax=Pseudomonas sp. 102515 TaxID=3071568 RepID=UPI002801195A|nr:DUF4398 domain-containing protein [Pseudomonas sp. 102515]MDQ7914816.1 DUF4398 domain-containing protein [Pseudomonas sp. 102515]
MKTGPARAFPFSAPRALLASLILGGGLLLAGCAGNPPTAQMAVTQSAVNEAVSGGGNQFAPIETKSAQDKWTQAQAALSNEKYDEAKQLAEQAEWDARLATRKTQAAKAAAALQDAQNSIQQIREEGQINLQLQQNLQKKVQQ